MKPAITGWLMVLLILPAMTVLAEPGVDEAIISRLRDRAFCSPDNTFPQTQAWQDQAIVYDRWANGADLAITLDQQIYQLLLPIIQEYAAKTKQEIRVREGTCGISAGLVSRKQVDIAGFCCPPAVTDRLPGLTFHTLGIASIAILAHPDNPMKSLSFTQLKEIFQGKPRHWSEVKENTGQIGPHWPIQTIGRLHCKLRPGHWRTLHWEPDDFSPRMEEVGTIPDMIHQVMANKGAIGYETLWHVQRYQEKGRPKTLSIDDHSPQDPLALLNRHYPLYHVFNLTLWEGDGLANPKAKALTEFLIKAMESMDPRFSMIPASTLRQAGWKFQGNELIGEPEK